MSRQTILTTLFIILVLASPLVSIAKIKQIIRIRKTKTYWISALPPEGLVEVVGSAEGTPVKSPYSDKDCLVWKVKVEEKRKTARQYHNGRYYPGHETWATVYERVSDSPFVVRDETAEISVSAGNIDLDAVPVSFNAVTSTSLQCLEELGVDTHTYFGDGKAFRITESLILPGDEVFINGEVTSNNGCKTIASITQPLLITSQGEKGMLSNLYLSVAGITLLVIVFGVTALIFFWDK